MSDMPLLDWTPPTPRGETFSEQRDGHRLSAQARRVYEVMKDGHWRGLRDIANATGDPEASISARLRDLRRLPQYSVNRKFIARGLWHYRLVKL